jgi:hypothetical protein
MKALPRVFDEFGPVFRWWIVSGGNLKKLLQGENLMDIIYKSIAAKDI